MWPGRKRHDGYGVKHIGRKTTGAHRWVWEQANGPIPDGLCVCHKCDNRPCTELVHLFLGTKQDNSDDAVAKGRSLRGERAPSHKLTEREMLEVRELRAARVPVAVIAVGYGISTRLVYYICRGERWRWSAAGLPDARASSRRRAAA